MKKLLSIALSIVLALSMFSSFVAYAGDNYELPPLPIPHKFGEWVTEKEPTCTEDGKKVSRCSHCNAVNTQIIPALGHSFGEWTESEAQINPTCTAAGKTAVETRVCSRCLLVETRGGNVINALNHDYKGVVTQPTCTEQGYTTYSCTRCDSSYVSDYTASKGHTPAEAVKENIVEASHQNEGSYDSVVYCSVCNAELSREKKDTPSVPHIPGDAVTENSVEPKCTTDGSYDSVVYCTDCNAELSRTKVTVPAEGHKFGEWEQTAAKVEPTCTQAGSEAVETHKCANCETVEKRGGEVIPALDHEYETKITPPTCTEKGYTTYTCIRGDSTYISDYTDAKGHTPKEAVRENVVEATYTAAGSYDAVVYCADCNAELSRTLTTIPKLTLPSDGSDFEAEGIPFEEIGGGSDSSKPSNTAPAKTAIKKLKKGKKSFKASWKKVRGVSGYQLQYSTNKKFKKRYKGKKHTVKSIYIKNVNKTSRTVKKLKVGKKYYVRIRTYKTVGGKKVYSKWSKVKTVKIKK